MKPLISVIVVAYNSSNSIDKCLDSILNQTASDMELIVINDNSTDDTLDKLDKLKDRIILINNKRRLGLHASYNKGLEVAKGQYLGFVNSSDYIDPRMYEEMIQAMDDDTDLVVSGWFKVYKDGMTPVISKNNITDSHKISSISHYVFDKLFKKSIIDEYKIRFSKDKYYYDDLDFIVRYQYYCNQIYLLKEPYYYLSFKKEIILDINCYNDMLTDLKKIITFYDENGCFKDYEKELIKLCSSYYLDYLDIIKKTKDIDNSKKGVYEFLQFFKNNFKHYKLILGSYHSKILKIHRSSYLLMKLFIYYYGFTNKR